MPSRNELVSTPCFRQPCPPPSPLCVNNDPTRPPPPPPPRPSQPPPPPPPPRPPQPLPPSPPRPTQPPPPASCSQVRCPPGTQCRMLQLPCNRQPCPAPSPTSVSNGQPRNTRSAARGLSSPLPPPQGPTPPPRSPPGPATQPPRPAPPPPGPAPQPPRPAPPPPAPAAPKTGSASTSSSSCLPEEESDDRLKEVHPDKKGNPQLSCSNLKCRAGFRCEMAHSKPKCVRIAPPQLRCAHNESWRNCPTTCEPTWRT